MEMNEKNCLNGMILFVEEEENEFWMGGKRKRGSYYNAGYDSSENASDRVQLVRIK